MDINYLADNEKNRQAFQKWKGKWLFSANPIKCAYLGIFACRIHFCTENRAKFYDF